MSDAKVTKEGIENARPGREALTGSEGTRPQPAAGGERSRPRRKGRGEQPMVPDATFESYYGKPVINQPVWTAPDIPGYFFLGGMAGAGSVLAAGASLTGRRSLARATKVGAAASAALSAAALVHDLGVPGRFYNMLRVFKPTSPMSVGSWLLGAYGPAAAVAAATDVTGVMPRVGAAATAGAALVGPAVAAYTAVLVADTAVPAWHDGYREMPFVFVGSGATAAAGLGLLGSTVADNGPARRLAVVGAATELLAAKTMERRMGMVAEPYRQERGGRYMRAGQVLTAVGVVGATLLGRRSRMAAAASGAALMTASACTRWGIYHAGLASAADPKYTVVPQRERARAREEPKTGP